MPRTPREYYVLSYLTWLLSCMGFMGSPVRMALLRLGAPVIAVCQNAEVPTASSYYVTTRDGTRLALDVYLPPDRAAGDRHPALLMLTRYGRSREDAQTGKPLPSLGPLDRFFLEHGHAFVKVDAR